ncbi:MAG: VPA1262 family N-terminal domain-containing protein [Muribaculum sp.]|nr:VPA1262 family N-terminal domain-containing protein [Muribaculum sp.]
MDYNVRLYGSVVRIPVHIENIVYNVTTYVESAEFCNPEYLFEFESGSIPQDVDSAIAAFKSYISKILGVEPAFMDNRIGNIEIFVSADYDPKGKPLVNISTKRIPEFCLKVYFDAILSYTAECLTVNAKLYQGDFLLSDSLQTIKPQDLVEFMSKEKVSHFEISVWSHNGAESYLIHHAVHCFVEKINLNIGIEGQKVIVKNDWFEKIRLNTPKDFGNKIDEAEVIAPKSYENTTISDDKNDKKNLQAKSLCKKVSPKIKSNDCYFPKGWDKESESHGALDFLNWFRRITRDTVDVFLQDPFFEDVALNFIASASAETSARFTILAQVDLKTNPDGTSYIDTNSSVRKDKILQLIRNYPSLFQHLQLRIQNLTGKDNKLHDRYLILKYSDGTIKGFTLSNSLQGATTKQPLLITQIGDDALEKVQEHIKSSLEARNNSNEIEVIYDSEEERINRTTSHNKEIADSGFAEWLYSQIKAKSLIMLSENKINLIIDDILYGPYSTPLNIPGRLATIGQMLASIPGVLEEDVAIKIANVVKERADITGAIKSYILNDYDKPYPIGYKNLPLRTNHYFELYPILTADFKEVVDKARTHFIDYAFSENFSYGCFGQSYACKILANASLQDALDVLEKLKQPLRDFKGDPLIAPICKVVNSLIYSILSGLLFNNDRTVISNLLNSSDSSIKWLGFILLLYALQTNTISWDIVKAEISKLPAKDSLFVLNTVLSICPRLKYGTVIFDEIYNSISTLNYEEIINEIRSFLTGIRLSEVKKEYIHEIIPQLIDNGFLSTEAMEKILIDDLYNLESDTDVCQILIPFTLGTIKSDSAKLLEKAKRDIDNYVNESSRAFIPNPGNKYLLKIPLYNLRKLLSNIDPSFSIIQEIDRLLNE